MLMKFFLIGGVLALSLPLTLDAASEPTPAPMAPAFLTAQASHPTPQPSPTAAPVVASTTPVPTPVATLIPTAVLAVAPLGLSGTGYALSPTVDADGDSVEAEEVGEDGKVAASTVSPDLSKLDSETLALIAGGVDNGETQEVYFDPKAKQVLSEGMPGAWRVSVEPLYNELARRTLADNKDKAARQSFALALFKDGERAKYAKDLAFDDHSADVVIAQLEGGRASARMDLQKLAEKGNRKARLYLGLDKPVSRADAGAASGTAQTLSPTAAPVAATPSAAVAPQAVSAPAQPSASPVGVSPPAALNPKK